MEHDKLFFKGNINENYNEDAINKKFPINEIESFLNEIKKVYPAFNKENYLEISHKFSPVYKIMAKEFKKSIFLSDNSFESLLTYHYSKIDKIDIDVLNYDFSYNSLASLKLNEKIDFIFSLCGLTFENLYTSLPQIIGFLKIDGILALIIPAYWYIKNNQTENEKNILDYSKQNDKKWIFVEPIEPIIEKNGAEKLILKELPHTIKFNRFELSYISSLNKLHDSIKQNNKAHLEVVKIPEENIEIRSSLLLIKKKQKTITKDNLFKL